VAVVVPIDPEEAAETGDDFAWWLARNSK